MIGDALIFWLLEEKNPAVAYRTRTEILGRGADKAPVATWLNTKLPKDWMERKGLWSRYFVTAFGECGLSFEDVPLPVQRIIGISDESPFEYGCADFMHLRALVRLGLAEEPAVAEVIRGLSERQLPDGGFLCLRRLNKLGRVPKSCVKANMHALMFCAELKKKGVELDITAPLINYFFQHGLFYRKDRPEELMLNGRPGWRTIDTFFPFEPMRVGIQNVVESLCALGFGGDNRLQEAIGLLNERRDSEGKYVLDATLTKSYLPKERVGGQSKWVTFYALLSQKGQ